MRFSTKGRYALRMMIDLAQHNTGEYISLKEISKRQEVSVKYLEQIVTQLCKSGFLQSIRGPQGGYRLAKHPTEYTAGDILRATEGSLAPIPCLKEDAAVCSRYARCGSIQFWEGLAMVMNNYVDSITLDDLLRQCQGAPSDSA